MVVEVCSLNLIGSFTSLFHSGFDSGFPEIGGLTSIQGLEIIRGCRGLNVVGADMVEV